MKKLIMLLLCIAALLCGCRASKEGSTVDTKKNLPFEVIETTGPEHETVVEATVGYDNPRPTEPAIKPVEPKPVPVEK